MPSSQAIARQLPDLPRWVEARDLLLGGDCEIYGLVEQPELALVIRDPSTEFSFVIGSPAVIAVRQAVAHNVRGGELVAPPEQADWLGQALPEWTYTRIIVHSLPDHQHLPTAAPEQVGFLDRDTLDQLAIPEQLRWELSIGAAHSLIAATFVAQQPVAFCYAGARTESLWDVAIDTLPEHRRQGYAALCAAFMIRHMQAQGKQPVWQSIAENPASWRLAQKLGFVPVDALALFEPVISPQELLPDVGP